jgi:hypothetical protein
LIVSSAIVRKADKIIIIIYKWITFSYYNHSVRSRGEFLDFWLPIDLDASHNFIYDMPLLQKWWILFLYKSFFFYFSPEWYCRYLMKYESDVNRYLPI